MKLLDCISFLFPFIPLLFYCIQFYFYRDRKIFSVYKFASSQPSHLLCYSSLSFSLIKATYSIYPYNHYYAFLTELCPPYTALHTPDPRSYSLILPQVLSHPYPHPVLSATSLYMLTSHRILATTSRSLRQLPYPQPQIPATSIT